MPISLAQRLFRKDKFGKTNNGNASETTASDHSELDETGLILLNKASEQQPSTYALDVIAVHGLGGGAYKTWTHENGKLWLRDFLLEDLPSARVFTYGYNSTFVFSRETGTLRSYARALLEEIRSVRQHPEERERPLIFVCHSMGGLILKQAMIIARNESNFYPGLGASVSAILFLGTPHQGSLTATYASILLQIANVLVIGSQLSRLTGTMRTELLQSLEMNEKELLSIAQDFRVHTGTIQIASCIEQKIMLGLHERIVDEKSGYVGASTERIIPMPGCDHREICKFGDQKSNYKKMLAAINDGIPASKVTVPSTQGVALPKPHSLLPFEQNNGYVKRSDITGKLDKLLYQNTNIGGAALWGLGGCGKTQIALEYAYTYQQKTSCSIFWVHADSEARFIQGYNGIAKKAGILSDLKAEDLLEAVCHWIEQLPEWLLIFDNADNIKVFKKPFTSYNQENKAQDLQLLRFIPKSSTGKVLWTSRDGDIVGSLVDIGQGVYIGAMTEKESLILFHRLSRESESAEPVEGDLKLLGLLENLPLAIAQAAAYIRKRKISIGLYLSMFQESEVQQLNLLGKEFNDMRRLEVPNSVMHTWLISMKQISQESHCAERILNTIAFWDNKGLPFELLRAAAGPEYSEDDVLSTAGRLYEYSFLQVQQVSKQSLPSYEEHRLVQLATRLALDRKQTSLFSGLALQAINQLFPSGKHDTWDLCKLFLPHSLKAVMWQEAEGYNEDAPSLLARIGTYYWTEGRSDEAEKLQVEVLALQKTVLGDKHPDTITAMANLASTWWQQGRSDEAEKLQVEVLALQKTVLRDKHPDTITAMANLASTWWQQGRSDEAEKLQVEVLVLQKTALGDKHPDTIRAMANLASTWQQQGRSDEAEKLKIEVLALRKTVLGDKHPDTITAMANLASTLQQQGRSDEAEKLKVEVLALRKTVLGDKHPDTIRAMANLALTWWQQGRSDEAEKLEVEVLALQKTAVGDKHPDTITAMANLASTWWQQGRSDEAEQLQVEVLALQKTVLGDKHPDTLTAMANLASTWWQQGRSDEAEQLQVEVLALQKTVLGDKHPDTIRAMANLASTLQQQGRSDEAEKLLMEILMLQKIVLGDKHPDTIMTTQSLRIVRGGP